MTAKLTSRGLGPCKVALMDQQLDVDALFTAFVRSYGGEIVEDLVGKNPGFRNADFLFREAGIVGELKRLSVDGSADAALRRKLTTKYQEWITCHMRGAAGGLIPTHFRSTVSAN
jgi:hypothetical protein